MRGMMTGVANKFKPGPTPGPVFYNTLALNGTDQYISLNDNLTLDFSAGVTASIWVYLPSGYAVDSYPVQKWSDSPEREWQIKINADKTIRFLISGDGGVGQIVIVTGSTVLDTEKWYLISGRADGTNVEVLIDGVVDGTTGSSLYPFGGTGSLIVGVLDDAILEGWFDGDLSSLIINTSALSDTVILNDIYNNGVDKLPADYSTDVTDTAVAIWPLNTGVPAGTEADDYSGVGTNDGTLVNAPTYTGALKGFEPI